MNQFHLQHLESDRQPEFEIEMVDDTVDDYSEMTDDIADMYKRITDATYSYAETADDATKKYVEIAAWQPENSNLDSCDSMGNSAIDSGVINKKHLSKNYPFPKNVMIKTEPQDGWSEKFRTTFDMEASDTVNNKRTIKGCELRNWGSEGGTDTHVFQNEWLQQNNIVIKSEPEDNFEGMFPADKQTSIQSHHTSNEMYGSATCVYNENTVKHGEYSAQVSKLQSDGPSQNGVVIKSEPLDAGNYGIT